MLDLQNICKNYGDSELFVNAGFRVNKGEHAGLVGPNGIGKTTIFRIITGEEYPDKGNVSMPNNVRISYLKQNLGEDDISCVLLDFTVRNAIPELNIISNEIHRIETELSESSELTEQSDQNKILTRLGELQHRFEALGGYTLRNDAEKALSGLGFPVEDFERPLSTFSGGWQMRASLAKVLISNPDIMLLDEPSNYLDIPAIEWLRKYLKTFQGTLLLISHDRYLLNSLTSVTLEVNAGKITRYEGNYDTYARERNLRENQIKAAIENQEKRVEQIERFVERFRYKSSKATQVQSRIKMLEKMDDIVQLDRIRYTGKINLPPPPKCGSEALRLENASFGYGGSGFVLEDVSLEIKSGDKMAVIGYNGAGKTTLLKIIAGILKPGNGVYRLGHNVIIGYQAQEFGEILNPDNTVYETLSGMVTDKTVIRPVLGRFGFSGDDIFKQCKVLSGGEKIRLLFARLFANPPNLLVLDEPTTHLDIKARENLQETIKSYHGTVLFVSHDIEFVRNTADSIVLIAGHKLKKYFGGYDYYLEKSSEETAAEEPSQNQEISEKDEKKALRRLKAEQRQKLYPIKKRLTECVRKTEDRINALESEKEELTSKLISNAAGTDYGGINKRIKEIGIEVSYATIDWEKYSLELEALEKEEGQLTVDS